MNIIVVCLSFSCFGFLLASYLQAGTYKNRVFLQWVYTALIGVYDLLLTARWLMEWETTSWGYIIKLLVLLCVYFPMVFLITGIYHGKGRKFMITLFIVLLVCGIVVTVPWVL